jgi:signal transduction histidine kinase/integral membrane sensor domain MASE1
LRRVPLIPLLAFGAAYVVAAKIGFRAAFTAEQVSPVWPPTGLALWAILYFGWRSWPAIWIGAFIANITTHVPWLAASGIATGNTLEALLAAWLLRRFFDVDRTLDSLRQVTGFVAAAAVGSTVVSATVGVTTLCAAGLQPWARFGLLWSIWWLGDATGALLVAPVLLTSSWLWRRDGIAGRPGEAAALEGAAIVASLIVFVLPLTPLAGRHPLEFAVFPLVIWAGLRFAHPGAALVSATISCIAVWGTLMGGGPFTGETTFDEENIILLQIFTAVIATSGLVLGGAIADRNRSDRLRAADHMLTAVLSEARDLKDALPRILQSFCETLDWDVANVWSCVAGHDALQYVSSWRRDARYDSFIDASRAKPFAAGVGLPGRVWASGQAAWIDEVAVDPNSPRAPAATRVGLRSACGFPILLGRDVVGIMEFFARDTRRIDPALLTLMSAAGSQIGQFIELKRVDAARAESLAREHEARVEAEQANRSKDQFLATVSHELRTPLTAILGWSSMLRSRDFAPDRARDIYESVYRNAEIQARIVNDLLDVSRIVTGQLKLDLQAMDVCEVARLSLETIRPAANARGVTLDSDIPTDECRVSGDPARLQQVIWNLLSNAIKFTPAGGSVALAIRPLEGSVVIEVSDTGIGIVPASLPRVFERFWQADSTSTRSHSGLGLGLALVRHIVELHGGEVRAESDGPERGSRFTVTLPAATRPSALSLGPRDSPATPE